MNRQRRLKVLLTEGSSLSARQTLYALGSHHRIDICDPNPHFCLGRFSRFVRRVYRCPPFGRDPLAFLEFLKERVARERYDVLLPVHDQVFLLARFQQDFAGCVALPVPSFGAVERVQTKSAFLDLLEDLNLPHPQTTRVRSRRELEAAGPFPLYVKLPSGTAGRGVWHVDDAAACRELAQRLEAEGLFDGRRELLVQQPAPGILGVTQSVFQRGRLLAAHSYEARALGVGGSARARISAHHPQVLDHLRRIGTHLHWHGALMLDYLIDPATGAVAYLEANPRIGETMNATLSGVNLCELLIDVALNRTPTFSSTPRLGTKTHSLMMGLMALGQLGASRAALVAELWRAATGRDVYAGGEDELTRIAADWPSALPAAYLTLQLLIQPGAAKRIIAKTVDNYALTESGMAAITVGAYRNNSI